MVFTAEYVDVMSLEDGSVLQTIPLARTLVVDAASGVACVGDGVVTIDYVGVGTEAVMDDADDAGAESPELSRATYVPFFFS